MHCCKILLDRSLMNEEHPCHSMLPFEFSSADIGIKVLTCSMMDDNSGYSMIQITDENNSVVEGYHKADHGECTITKTANNRYIAMIVNRKCTLSAIINRHGCFLSSAVPRSETLIEWTIIGPNSRKIHDLIADMRSEGYNVGMVSSESHEVVSTLSPKQESCFDMAMDLGYYDVPKRISLDELSRIIGCSKSTLNVTLRTAEKKIFDFYRVVGQSRRFVK